MGSLRESVRLKVSRFAVDVTSEIRSDLQQIGSRIEGRVLDLGCGVQPYRSLFPKASSYIGADMPPARSTNGLPKHAQVYCRVEKLPFSNGSFNAVLCTQVLEHVPEPAGAIAEASRILSPGGQLILTIPFVAAEHEEPHDYFRFTQFGIRALLEAHGFECGRVKKQFGFWPAIGEMVYWHVHRKVQGGWLEKYWYAFGTTIFLRAFHLMGRFDPDDKFALNLCVVARRKQTAAETVLQTSSGLAAD